MDSHAPTGYICPICLGNRGVENEHTLIMRADRIYAQGEVIVYINSFFIKNNPGHVIVVPKHHFENVYSIPDSVMDEIGRTSKLIATAMKKAYGCTGITMLQNNEPDGGQHAFHYHLHVIPRYPDDHLYSHMATKQILPPKQRIKYATMLQSAIGNLIQ